MTAWDVMGFALGGAGSVPPLRDRRADVLQDPFSRDPGPDREQEHEVRCQLIVQWSQGLVELPSNCDRGNDSQCGRERASLISTEGDA